MGWEGKRRALKTLRAWGLTIGRMEPTDFHEENGRWVRLGRQIRAWLWTWRVENVCQTPVSFPILSSALLSPSIQ